MKRYNKATQSVVGGGAGGAALIWIWGMIFPDTPLPPETAALFAGALAAIINMIGPPNAA